MSLSPPGRHAIVIVLASLAALYGAYVLTVFVALEGGALAYLTRDSHDAKLSARGGYSFWPTRLVLKDARFRFKDYNIEMEIEAKEASIRWSPFALFRKTILIEEVRAEGARYEMVHRVKEHHPHRERLAAFPQTGFERSKIYDSPRPPYTVPPYRVRVESIRAKVIEAWILEYRATGQMEAKGGFEVHEQVSVLPSQVTLRGARILVRDRELASAVDCELSAKVGPFPGRESLNVALGTTDGKAACRAILSDLAPLQMYAPDSKLRLGGNAELLANIELGQGQLRSSDTRSSVRLRLGLGAATLEGLMQLALRVDPGQLAHFSGTFEGAPGSREPVALGQAKFDLVLEQPQLTRARLEHLEVQVRDLDVTEPEMVRFLSGDDQAPLVKLEALNVDLRHGARKPGRDGSFEVASRGGLAFFPKAGAAITCNHQASVRCSLGEAETSCPGTVLECTPVHVSLDRERSGSVAVTLRADTLEVSRERTSSQWTIWLGNPEPLLHATLPDSAWTELGLALAPLGAVQGRVRVNQRDRTFAGTIDQVRSGPFSARGGFMLATSLVSRWHIKTPLGRFGVSQTRSGIEIAPFVGADWDVLAFEE